MDTLFTPSNIMFVIGLMSVVFSVYNTFRNPQIKTDQQTITLRQEIDAMKKEVSEIKETHIKNVEEDIKSLNTAINALSQTVVKLATIIDERIPKSRK